MLARKTPQPTPTQRPAFTLSADLPFYAAPLDGESPRRYDEDHDNRRRHDDDGERRQAHANHQPHALTRQRNEDEEAKGPNQQQHQHQQQHHQSVPHYYQHQQLQHHHQQQLQNSADGYPYYQHQQHQPHYGVEEDDTRQAMEVVDGERQEEGSFRQKLRRS
jgi:hypothetical protein